MKFQIPEVDYKDLIDEKKRKDVAAYVVKNLEDIGFLYVTNVKDYDWKASLSATKWFFNQPEERKMQLALKSFNPENENGFYGYTPQVLKNDFFVETFCVGPSEDTIDNLTMSEKEEAKVFAGYTPKFDGDEGRQHNAAVRKTYNAMQACSMLLMQVIAEGLGEKPDFFDNLFKPTPGILFKYFFYPKKNHGDVKDATEKVVRLAAHADTDVLTLLDTFGEVGLEFKTKDGVWKAVEPVAGAILINIGEALSRITGRRLPSVVHRVVDTGVDRYSAPFFLSPWYGADISSGFHITKEEECEEKTPFILFILKILLKEKEYGNLKYSFKTSMLDIIDKSIIQDKSSPRK